MREIHAQAAQLKPASEEVWNRRLQRERDARAAAEAIIESKSRDLFEANRQLEELLGGTIKVLTQVLAMARPEIFEKAGKVQRWARRILPYLEIERPWELDLAAMLYPLGILSLPTEIADKYSHGEELSDNERMAVEECSLAAQEMLCHIPHMEQVSRAVLYCRKGFDGSGFPVDDVAGEEIPAAARVLKILIDLADDATGVTKRRDFRGLAKRKHLYDLKILKVAYERLHRDHDSPEGDGELLVLSPVMLRSGDRVSRDIVDKDNQILLAAGAELSEITIRRLRARSKFDDALEQIEVFRDKR